MKKLRDQKCDCHKNCQSGLILAFLISWYKTYPDPTTKNRKNFNLLMFRNTAGSTEYNTFSNELKSALKCPQYETQQIKTSDKKFAFHLFEVRSFMVHAVGIVSSLNSIKL